MGLLHRNWSWALSFALLFMWRGVYMSHHMPIIHYAYQPSDLFSWLLSLSACLSTLLLLLRPGPGLVSGQCQIWKSQWLLKFNLLLTPESLKFCGRQTELTSTSRTLMLLTSFTILQIKFKLLIGGLLRTLCFQSHVITVCACIQDIQHERIFIMTPSMC